MLSERKKEIESLVIKLESENIIQTEGSVRRFDSELFTLNKQHEKEIKKVK